MQYNQIILSPSGVMAYAEYDNGTLSRYCDYQGNTITPAYDYVFPASGVFSPSPNPTLPVAGQKQWMNGPTAGILAVLDANNNIIIPAVAASAGMTYQQVSFVSNTVQGYQINDDQGNISYADANGEGISIGTNGLTEIHIIAGNVNPPAWAI